MRAWLVAIAGVVGLGLAPVRADQGPPRADAPPGAQGKPVTEIVVVVRGARRTEPSAVLRLMSTRVGQPFDAETLERDLVRLRSTQMIYDTVASVEMTPHGPRLVLEVRDKWTAFVYAGARRGGARTITRVGVSDPNVLGRLVHAVAEVNSGADIPFYPQSSADRVGSAMHLTMPRLLGTRFSPALSWTREFFDFSAWRFDGRPGVIYDRDRFLYRLALRYDVTNTASVSLLASTFHDQFQINSLTRAPGRVPPSGRTTSGGFEVQLGSVNEWLSRYEGWQLTVTGEGSRRGVLASDHTTVTGTVAGKWFLVPLRGHNLGLSSVVSGTTGPSDSHLPRAGGLYEIRGFLDSTFVAQRISRANVEYRVEVLELLRPLHTISQVVAFVDGGYVSSRADAVAGLPYAGPVVSAGTGLRMNIVPLARGVGRVDFAFGLHPVKRFDLAFGVQQFF